LSNSTPIDHDVIEQLARATLAQLNPLSGDRGTGSVLVDNTAGGTDVSIDQNMYLLPVLGSEAGAGKGELRDDLIFKTAPNAATALPHARGGAWVVPAGETLAVTIRSNLGGTRHNLKAGTTLYWDPPLPGVGPSVSLIADITDGAERASAPKIARAAYYEGLDQTAIEQDLQGGRLSALPAVMLVWQQSAPAEGRTAGTNQGSTRAAAGVRFMSETFELYVIVGDHSSDKRRRGNGLRLLQAVTRFLSDQVQNTDGEYLATLGSLEVLSRNRYSRDGRHYVYALTFRVMRTLNQVDFRSYTPWLQTHLQATLPGRESPEPTDPILLVDVTDPNPPGPPP
jgi:hypothetical protein